MEKSIKRYWPVFILPTMAAFMIGFVVPFLEGIYLSFCDFTTIKDASFVGLENYAKAISDKTFTHAFSFTTVFAIVTLVLINVLAFAVALALTQKIKGTNIFRTVFFIPSVMSFMVVGLLWQLFFNPNVGPFNYILKTMGMNTANLNILGNPGTAIFGVIFASQWMYFGYMAMLLIIGIQKVPDELYEAAEIDGANALQRFWHITIPNIKEMILVDCIIIVVGSFKLFDEVFVMTNGGPGYASEVISTYLYRTAFRADMMGSASAMAVVLFVITFALSIFQMKISRSGEV